MLLEKAYAKLHGSYESLLHGQMEKVLQELTPAAHVKVLRSDHIPDEGRAAEACVYVSCNFAQNSMMSRGAA